MWVVSWALCYGFVLVFVEWCWCFLIGLTVCFVGVCFVLMVSLLCSMLVCGLGLVW